MSLTYWIPFFIVILGNVGYHVVAKATPVSAPAFSGPQRDLSSQFSPVCCCLRGDRTFSAAGSVGLKLGERCLGTDAGRRRIWLHPIIPGWLENQHGLPPG